MSSPQTQMVSSQLSAIDLLSRLVDQISTTPATCPSSPATTVRTGKSDRSSTTQTPALQSSNEFNGSTEVIHDIIDVPQVDNFSTSAVLHYCKRKVLLPYQRFLSLLGWRPIIALHDGGIFSQIGILFYTVIVILFTLFSYVLQYAACFRRDVLSGYKIVVTADLINGTTRNVVVCPETLFSTYVIPDILHLSAYTYMYYLIRIRENEQLQVLMERVFLQAFYTRSNYTSQPKLVRILRIFLGLTLGWIGLSIAVQILHVTAEFPCFTWMEPYNKSMEIVLIVLLFLTAIWTDLIHVTIIVSYSMQCQLLNSFIRGLCERVREKSITLEESIKEMGESAKILKYLNEDFAISVAFIMLHSGMMTVSGLVWAGTFINSIGSVSTKDVTAIGFNICCIILWASSFLFPLIQAARLTSACHCFQRIGLYLMTRPFGYQDEPLMYLTPFLTYTSSLKMQAKLFRIPVKPWAVFGFLTLFCCLILILFRCNVINLGI